MPDPDRLPVAVSKAELHAIETPESFEPSGSFRIGIDNHGRDAHVHLKVEGDLAAVAQLEEGNVYVERDATREVEVSVAPDSEGTTGYLRIETGYGSESAAVEVRVGSSEDAGVEVGESLNRPTGEPIERAGRLPEGWRPVAGLAAVAVLVAAATVLLVESTVVTLGVLVVLLGVLAAGYMLIR